MLSAQLELGFFPSAARVVGLFACGAGLGSGVGGFLEPIGSIAGEIIGGVAGLVLGHFIDKKSRNI